MIIETVIATIVLAGLLWWVLHPIIAGRREMRQHPEISEIEARKNCAPLSSVERVSDSKALLDSAEFKNGGKRDGGSIF